MDRRPHVLFYETGPTGIETRCLHDGLGIYQLWNQYTEWND